MSTVADLFKPAPEPPSELGRYRLLGPSCGLRISPFALGAMSLGEAWSGFMGSMTKEDSYKLLDRFYELGGNFIDTANNYQEQESESIIGTWMESRKNRDEIVLATKFTTQYKQSDKSAQIKVNFQGNHYKSMKVSVDDSLRKLKTDYIDILFVHWWDWTTSIPELMQGLNTLIQQGKVLYLGVSDTPAWLVAAANEYARANGMAGFVVYQGKYSALERDLERDVLPMARHYGMGVITWNSLLGGKLQTRAQIEERKKNGEGLRSFMGSEQSEQERKASELFEKIANEIGAKSITSVALAFVMQRKQFPNVFPIVGGRKISHLEQNIEALSITLTDEQIKRIEDELPLDIGFPINMIQDDPHYGAPQNFLMASSAKLAYVNHGHSIKPSDYKQ